MFCLSPCFFVFPLPCPLLRYCSALSQGLDSFVWCVRLTSACGDLAFHIGVGAATGSGLQLLFQMYGFFWAILLSCFLRQCCCLQDDVEVPKWALLMARFYQRAIFPPQWCLLVFALFNSTPVTPPVLTLLVLVLSSLMWMLKIVENCSFVVCSYPILTTTLMNQRRTVAWFL